MNKMRTVLALTLVVAPLAVMAQTANSPGGSAATGTGLDQTKPSGQRSSGPTGDTATNPGMTNPGGTLNKGTSSSTTGSSMSDTTPSGKSKMKGPKGKANETAPGEVPTYPAPAKDGTPTK